MKFLIAILILLFAFGSMEACVTYNPATGTYSVDKNGSISRNLSQFCETAYCSSLPWEEVHYNRFSIGDDIVSIDDLIHLAQKNKNIPNFQTTYNSNRIYFVAGMKNLELLRKLVLVEINDIKHKMICLKTIEIHSWKVDFNGHGNRFIIQKMESEFFTYLANYPLDEEIRTKMEKIVAMSIYCFNVDDLRNEKK